VRNPGDTHCPICSNSYSERKGQDCPEVHDVVGRLAEGSLGRIFRAQQERNELADKMGELVTWFDLMDEFAIMQGAPGLARTEIQDDIRRVQAILRGEA